MARSDGRLQGVEGVIDKDLTAALLATELHAERFIILTDVPHVCTGFGTAFQRPIRKMSVKTAESHLASGEFPPGSMGPKVEAAMLCARGTGCSALITDLDHLAGALEGEEGTWILA